MTYDCTPIIIEKFVNTKLLKFLLVWSEVYCPAICQNKLLPTRKKSCNATKVRPGHLPATELLQRGYNFFCKVFFYLFIYFFAGKVVAAKGREEKEQPPRADFAAISDHRRPFTAPPYCPK